MVALCLFALLFAAPAAAQAVSNGAEANETVQVVKSSLMGIAIVLLVLTIFYWIHTDPKRRSRAQSKKAARKQAFAKSRETGTEDDEPADADADISDASPILLLADEEDDTGGSDETDGESDYELSDVEREVS